MVVCGGVIVCSMCVDTLACVCMYVYIYTNKPLTTPHYRFYARVRRQCGNVIDQGGSLNIIVLVSACVSTCVCVVMYAWMMTDL